MRKLVVLKIGNFNLWCTVVQASVKCGTGHLSTYTYKDVNSHLPLDSLGAVDLEFWQVTALIIYDSSTRKVDAKFPSATVWSVKFTPRVSKAKNS